MNNKKKIQQLLQDNKAQLTSEAFTLPNGLRVVHTPITFSQVAHCGFIINSGTRDEMDHEHGIAHLIEHCIFKGTQKRKAFHILNRLDTVGGDLNAYTTKEETCVYASILNSHLDRAIELLVDITFNSVFPEKEIAKEKDVIKDEITSYLDSPSEQIYDDFEEMLFENHQLSHSILGTETSLDAISRNDIVNFYERNYTTSNIIFSCVANISTAKLKALLTAYTAHIQLKTTPNLRTPFTAYQPETRSVKKEIHQAHAVIGNLAYDYYSDKRRPLYLLNNILGGPAMNSRLNLNIREKYGFTYNIDASFNPLVDTGIFAIYLGVDAKSVNKCLSLVQKEMQKMKDTALGTAQLHMAKQQLMGQMALSMESMNGLMLSVGKSYLLYGKIDSVEEVFGQIEAITSADLLEVANEIFDFDQFTNLMYLPA